MLINTIRCDISYRSGEYIQRHLYNLNSGGHSERLMQMTDAAPGQNGNGGLERSLYVHEDVLGNTRYYTKDSGQSFAELQYDAWGSPLKPNKLINNDHGNFVAANYTGHPYDAVIDMYFAEARFYDADNRTWISRDPIKDGLNWYKYVEGNPVTYFDPTGLYDRVTLVAGGLAMNDDWHYNKTVNDIYLKWSVFGGTNIPQYLTEDAKLTHRPVNYDFTSAWSKANEQYSYFSMMECISNGVERFEPAENIEKQVLKAIEKGIQVGDLLYWDFIWEGKGSKIDHATIITGIEGDKIYYAGHNSARSYAEFNKAVKEYPHGLIYVVKIRDDA